MLWTSVLFCVLAAGTIVMMYCKRRLQTTSRCIGDIHILRHHRGGRGVASLMTTDDKGEGGIDRTDDVIKTVIL